jgi:hypothetical protein
MGPAPRPQHPSTAVGGQVHLSWDAPTARADGTTPPDIAGFKLYYGLISGVYAFVKTLGNQTSYALSGLEPGQTYYIVLTTIDSAGNESRLSDELTVAAPLTFDQSLLLTQDPIKRGQLSQFRVQGARPDEVVSFLFSTYGEGEGPCAVRLGGLCVDLIEPWVFGEATADAFGTAVVERMIPAGVTPGQQIAVQAVVQRGQNGTESLKTNVITAVVME